MRRKGLKKNKKGFTLVEVIVVLVIIGILLALAVPAITQYVGKAGDTKIATQIKSAFTAAQTFNTNNVANKPSISEEEAEKAITKDAVNGELGLEDGNKAAVTAITCDLNEDKKIISCEIKTVESEVSYAIKPNEEPVKKEVTPPAGE